MAEALSGLMKGGHYQQGPETWSLTRAGTPDEGLLCRSHSSHSLKYLGSKTRCRSTELGRYTLTFFPSYPLTWASHWASGARSQLASQEMNLQRPQPPGSRAGQMKSENISREQNKVGNGNREQSARRTNHSFRTLKLEKWSWMGPGEGSAAPEGGIYVYLELIHIVVQQKLTQHGKAIILQLQI